MAAPSFETAEIIEWHHDKKIDSPSGTAVRTAQRMAAASKDRAHDHRGSFMPGVFLAVRKIAERPGLTIGLDVLLGLDALLGL